MISQILCLTVAMFLIGTNAEFLVEKDRPYYIQSVADGTFLKVLYDHNLCQPLSEVVPEKDATGSDMIWTPSWWGETPTTWGYHLHNFDKLQNQITFQNFPPNCYPVYNSWDIHEVQNGVTLQVRETGLCLASNGLIQPVDFQVCDSTSTNQIWKFAKAW